MTSTIILNLRTQHLQGALPVDIIIPARACLLTRRKKKEVAEVVIRSAVATTTKKGTEEIKIRSGRNLEIMIRR
jgi:hypothetical protein